MPNQTEVECYFKSSDLEKLCKQGNDILINFLASYAPGKIPEFTITASVFNHSGKKVTVEGMLTDVESSGGSSASGCPQPCSG